MRRAASSWASTSSASGTRIVVFLVRFGMRFWSMSRRLLSISSIPCGVITSIIGDTDFVTSISTVRSSSLPSRSMRRSFSRVSVGSGCGVIPMVLAGGRGEEGEQSVLGQLARPHAVLLLLLLAHHGDGQLGEVADDRLDVAPDVADLGELGRFHLDEGGLRQLARGAWDLALPDARGPDYD